MSKDVYSSYPPDLNAAQEGYLLSNLKDWSITNGLAVRPAPSFVSADVDPSGALAATAPVTLFPSLFPRVCFEQAKSVAKAYNELYTAIASNESWLGEVIEELLDIDDYIAQLWKIHLAVKEEGVVQDLALGLFRSDYMVHVDQTDAAAPPTVKQVEFNTIASSFGGLSGCVSGLHRHLHDIGAYPDSLGKTVNHESLPASTSVSGLARGMSLAHSAYGASDAKRPLCVIFLVQDLERNVFDQRHVEYELNRTHGVRSFRLPFSRVLEDTKLDDQRRLLYHPPQQSGNDKAFEVSLVYFRAGYAPSEYDGPKAWQARLHIERSAAIKCPNILTHLAGSKKVQQVLATPQSPHLARFLPQAAQAEAVLKTFAPIYPLDKSDAGMQARQLATNVDTAVRYVVKPQREGGGNNIYRKDIPDFLKDLPESHWPAHILMEMIEPPAQKNVIFRNGELQSGEVICELGVYGACLWKNGAAGEREILENFEAGFLLRTKGAGSSEGGVAAGFGCVDSPCLV